LLPESLGDLVDFQRWYRDVYDHYAASDQPAALGLELFVHRDGNPVVATVDAEPERDLEEDLRPYWIAAFAFADDPARVTPGLGQPAPSAAAGGARADRDDPQPRAGRAPVGYRPGRRSFRIGLAEADEGTWDGCGLAATSGWPGGRALRRRG